MDLNGRRVLVTGASRGIGAAIARCFAAAGARVALVARSPDPLRALADELGGTAHAADLADRDAVAGLIERVEADGGPVDVLVNNAGIDAVGAFADTDPDDLEMLYRVNLVAPVLLTRLVLPGMIARDRGQIVNISSLAGVAALPGLAAYSSTKAGLTHFTAGLRADLRGLPVGTTVVEIGPIRTDMLANVAGYHPTEASFRRFGLLQILPELQAGTVAEAVVDAVRHGREHVRLPRRAAPQAIVTEIPRRLVEVLLTGVPHQDGRATRGRRYD